MASLHSPAFLAPSDLQPMRVALPILYSILLFCTVASAAAPETLVLHEGDTVVLIGNTLAERMQYFGNWESLLHARFPEKKLVVRDLGWSADELTLRPRSLNFQDHGHRLEDLKPDVILALFGFNESF